MKISVILIYIVAALFWFLGVGIFRTAMRYKLKHIGLDLGAACYLLGSIGAFSLTKWWPLIIAFVLAWIFRALGGDPGYR